jgi:hypothetical protein
VPPEPRLSPYKGGPHWQAKPWGDSAPRLTSKRLWQQAPGAPLTGSQLQDVEFFYRPIGLDCSGTELRAAPQRG